MLDIAVTNRHLCKGDFLVRLNDVALHKPFAILLREKDLDFNQYNALAQEAQQICKRHGMPLIAHTYPVPCTARLHVPFHLASKALAEQYALSVSVHSTQEALEAQAIGADFLIAGHIFSTACKPGINPRGLAFLQEICDTVTIPVFAIGGITSKNVAQCLAHGAAGVCRMSYWMEGTLES